MAADSTTDPRFLVPPPPEIKEALTQLARQIAGQLPPGWGFGLFLYQFGMPPGEGGMFWISNGNRSDMVKALQEWIYKAGSS